MEVFCSYLTCFNVLDRFYGEIRPRIDQLFKGRACSSVTIMSIEDRYVCCKSRLTTGMINFEVYITDNTPRRVVLGARSFLLFGGGDGTGTVSVFGNLRVVYEVAKTTGNRGRYRIRTPPTGKEFIVVRFRLDKL
jgi:hypothetical protein